MAKAKILLIEEIKLNDGTTLPKRFMCYILSEESSSVTNPLTVLIYSGEKIVIPREKIKEIIYEREENKI